MPYAISLPECLEIPGFLCKSCSPFNRYPHTVIIESLINSGKPLEAWDAIQGLPPRLKFTTQTMRQRLRCATLLGWTRRAAMLEVVIANQSGEDDLAFSGNFSDSPSRSRELLAC
jgi:hypothetical protein